MIGTSVESSKWLKFWITNPGRKDCKADLHHYHLYLFTYLSIYLSIYLRTYLPIYQPFYLPVYLFTYLCIYLSSYLPTIYLPTYLPTYLYTCPHDSKRVPNLNAFIVFDWVK